MMKRTIFFVALSASVVLITIVLFSCSNKAIMSIDKNFQSQKASEVKLPERLVVHHISLSDLEFPTNELISLVVIVNENGDVVEVEVDVLKTSTSDTKLLQKICLAVKDQLKYEMSSGVGLESRTYTISIETN